MIQCNNAVTNATRMTVDSFQLGEMVKPVMSRVLASRLSEALKVITQLYRLRFHVKHRGKAEEDKEYTLGRFARFLHNIILSCVPLIVGPAVLCRQIN